MKLTVDRDDTPLDLLLWRALQRNDEALVLATLDANPGLCDAGVFLPVGTIVHVPEIAPVKERKSIRLWD